MFSLSQARNHSGTVLKILGGVIVVAALIALIITRFASQKAPQITPAAIPPPQIAQNPSQKQPQTIDFSDTQIGQMPEELLVYSPVLPTFTDSEFKSIGASFGVLSEPSSVETDTLDGTVYRWSTPNTSLTINNLALMYRNLIPENPQVALPQNQLQQIAQDFIQKIPVLDKSINLDPKETTFLNTKTEDFVSEPSFESAQLLELNYFKKLSNFPLYFGSTHSPYLKIRIRKNGTVDYLNSKLFADFRPEEAYKLKTPQTAIFEIKNGKGKIIETLLPDENNKVLELYREKPLDIETLRIKSLNVAYYQEPNTEKPIQPIFVAIGEFETANGEKAQSTIFLPAIAGGVQ